MFKEKKFTGINSACDDEKDFADWGRCWLLLLFNIELLFGGKLTPAVDNGTDTTKLTPDVVVVGGRTFVYDDVVFITENKTNKKKIVSLLFTW